MNQSNDLHHPAKANLLVAEDDQIARLVLKKVLEQAGYQVDFAIDGLEAISALKLMDYDLILMDCSMPRMDGFATTRYIRKSNSLEINSQIPVIAMTGLTGEDDRRRCLEAGMDDHVAKPVNAGELFKCIEQCLGRDVELATLPARSEDGEEPILEDAFLDKLLVGFLAEIPGVIDALQHAMEKGDLDSLERIGHRLCGASDILEIGTLSNRSRALEQAGKDGDLSSAGTITSELIADLKRLEMAVSS